MDTRSIEILATSFENQIIKLAKSDNEALLKQAILAQELATSAGNVARGLYERYQNHNDQI